MSLIINTIINKRVIKIEYSKEIRRESEWDPNEKKIQRDERMRINEIHVSKARLVY